MVTSGVVAWAAPPSLVSYGGELKVVSTRDTATMNSGIAAQTRVVAISGEAEEIRVSGVRAEAVVLVALMVADDNNQTRPVSLVWLILVVSVDLCDLVRSIP